MFERTVNIYLRKRMYIFYLITRKICYDLFSRFSYTLPTYTEVKRDPVYSYKMFSNKVCLRGINYDFCFKPMAS